MSAHADSDTQLSIAQEERDSLLKSGSHPNRALRKEHAEQHGSHEEFQVAPERSRPAFRFPLLMILGILNLILVIGVSVYLSPIGGYAVGIFGKGDPLSLNDGFVLDPNWNMRAAPTRREFHWTISDRVLNPDGVFRDMIVINGEFPGPLIECNEGDTIIVHVNNQAANATAIHFHGLFQNSTNHMDGTVGVTQCPIAPGRHFTYEFNVRGQSGTYWYHGHVGLQASDGLFGPLVIHPREPRDSRQISYDTDRVIMVQDYYHDLSSALMLQYLEPNRENEEPVPDGALINGQNVRDCSISPHRHCDNSTSSLANIWLEPREKHRLRFINVGAIAEFQISIDEHEFAVVEVDGTEVVPVHYHRLTISPGQRYSIVLSPEKDEQRPYWLRAKMITSCFRGTNPNMEPETRAIVRYDSSSLAQFATTPQSKDWPEAIEVECKDMNVTELVPLHKVTPPEPDHLFNIMSNFEIGNWRLSRGFFNETSWRPRVDSPILTRAIDGLSASNSSFSNLANVDAEVNDRAYNTDREFVVQTTGIQTLDIVIQNLDDGNHPFHLHGHKFFVLGHGVGFFDSAETYPTLDLDNPLRRDTATVEAYGWLLIRFIADNPGVWAMHCHVTWHTEAGLLMNFLTRADVLKDWKLPDSHRSLCYADGLEKGMGPKDEIWFGNPG